MLTIDVGNTRIKWGVWRGDQLEQSGGDRYESAQLLLELDRIFGSMDLPDQVVICCVAGEKVKTNLVLWFEEQGNHQLSFIESASSAMGVTSAYQRPEQLGVDRWVAMIAAHHKYSDSALCVIDAGTAVTLDYMTAEGRHMGGLIMPGIELMRKSLYQGTDALAEIPGNQVNLARNTQDAVYSGCASLMFNGIPAVYEKLCQQYGDKAIVVVTGGDAEKLAEYFDNDCLLEPNLILYGLRLLAPARD